MLSCQWSSVGESRHRDHFFRALKAVLGLYQKLSKISLQVEGQSDFLRPVQACREMQAEGSLSLAVTICSVITEWGRNKVFRSS